MTVTPQDDSEFGAESGEPEVEQATEGSETEVESPEGTNDEVEDDGAGDEVSEPQEVEDDSPRFTVTIDGAEVEVTLDELQNGYLRQSDYTRKTQGVAAERERLASLVQLEQFLREDPAGTIAALQKAFAVVTDEVEQEEVDPVEERLRKSEAFIARQEAAAREAQIVGEAQTALAAVQIPEATYMPAAGPNAGVALVGPEALLQFAIDNQIGNLTVAARLLRSEQTPAPQVKAGTAAKTEQKRAASVVEGGRTKAPATTTPAKAERMTLREAYQAAKAAQST